MENVYDLIIIGAGPAGLTAAFELLDKTEIQPIIIEKDVVVGGLSRTVEWKGNRIDIGGHRFFSKSDEVMRWWDAILPVLDENVVDGAIGVPETGGMLVRRRLSRIVYRGRLFEYPLALTLQTVRNLGVFRTFSILVSYLRAWAFPRRPEASLEDFFVNKFGEKLFQTFFRDYTEKVWGVPCREIRADWGSQRIRGLSLYQALVHAARSIISKQTDLAQKGTETSLIERFLYPVQGPGQLWQTVARKITDRGGEIRFSHTLKNLSLSNGRISAIEIENTRTREIIPIEAEYVFSSMPLSELVATMGEQVPETVRFVASQLRYRDFITVGLVCRRFMLPNEPEGPVRDTWLYIQEPHVKVGRIQIFNNWSPWMVKDPDTVWIGLEYFANKGDSLWSMNDEDCISLAKDELVRLGMAAKEDIIDGTVVRMEKAYPSYIGEGYERLGEIKEFLLSVQNLYPVGRNGMHRYNNQDHSMLMAMRSVQHVMDMDGTLSREEIWSMNTEEEYHEKK